MFKPFDHLYKLLTKQELLIQAFGNIQKNKPSLTPGTDPSTADAYSLEKIKKLARELELGEFRFSDIRRKWIVKPKLYKPGEPLRVFANAHPKKIRPLRVFANAHPLGIPNF